MNKRIIACISIAFAICFVLAAVSYAAEQGTTGNQAKNFWQKLFNYPANVTKESVNTVADTAKRGTEAITDGVKTVGQVTSGEAKKGSELATEPVKATADVTGKSLEQAANIPVKAAKE